MRLVWLVIGLWGITGAAQAQSASAALENCLPPREMQEAVAAKGVVAPASAVITARRQVPGADVVRASLCRKSDALVYVIMVLQKDGRIVQVMIGKIGGTLGNIGTPVDLYAASPAYAESTIATWTPGSTSDKQISFKITGKNASSTGFTQCIDLITLTPQ